MVLSIPKGLVTNYGIDRQLKGIQRRRPLQNSNYKIPSFFNSTTLWNVLTSSEKINVSYVLVSIPQAIYLVLRKANLFKIIKVVHFRLEFTYIVPIYCVAGDTSFTASLDVNGDEIR